MFVIVGLGNPEPRYARNRHNIGFQVVEAFAEKAGADPWRAKFHAEIARCRASGGDALLVRPMTYMNDSGRSIQALSSYFRVPISDMLVVHDELDLPFGTLRLKPGGGHAGHNGLRSVIQHLGRSDFARLRVGIGKPPPGFRGEVADFVLSDFDADQRERLPDVVSRAVAALRMVLRRGLAEATKSLNTKPKPPKKKDAPAAQTSPDAQPSPPTSPDAKSVARTSPDAARSEPTDPAQEEVASSPEKR